MSKTEYDASAAQLRQEISTINKGWYRSCCDLLVRRKLRGLDCLDLCSGNGEFSKILKKQFDMTVTCGEYIQLHLAEARAAGFRTIEIDLDADATVVDRIAKPHTETFDLVVNLASIEHVFCSDNLMRFAHRVLKPKGLLIINTPNMGFLAYRIYSLLNGNRPFGEGHHIRFWDFRYLRTALFFNGFEVIEDFRRFYSLPRDALTRGFRNRRVLAKLVSIGFYLCIGLQHLPFLRGLATDELTLLCRKENVTPIELDYLTCKRLIEDGSNPEMQQEALCRLNTARKRGWLREHLYMNRLIEENMQAIE